MWFALCTVGLCTVGLISTYVYYRLQQQHLSLSQELQQQQALKEQVFSQIHNTPLQALAFLMREFQVRHVPPDEVLNHLQTIYRELQTATHLLKED